MKTASPSCARDALQVMFDATAGKKAKALDCVRVLKRFSGPASVAANASLTGLHPYYEIWHE